MGQRAGDIKKGICGGLLVALVLSFAAQAQTNSPAAVVAKIGYIDVKRLIDNAPQFVEADAKLRRDFSARDEAIKSADAELEALKQRLARDGAIMSKDDADALKRKIDATEIYNKHQRDNARNEYNERARAETNRNLQIINDTAINYARTQGFDLIVANPVLYASPRIDITEAVLQRLKQSAPSAAKP